MRVSWTKSMIERLIRLHAAGCTDEEIALVLQIPRAAVISRRAQCRLTSNRDDPFGRSLKAAAHARAG